MPILNLNTNFKIMKTRLFRKIVLLFLALFSIQSIQAQTKIRGIVLDSLTRQPIPDLSILDIQNNRGTISNEKGEFEITVSSLPYKVLFSHISYKKSLKMVNSNDLGQVYMQLAVINLPELRTENPALVLLNAAINKAMGDTINQYPCRAFYQKISKEGNNITNIHEIFFDGIWRQLGLTKWQPTNARYARKDNSTFKFQNFTTSLFITTGAISKNTHLPYSIRNDKSSFTFRIEKFINAGTDDEIAELSCTPKLKEETYFEGEIYIKTKNENFVKIIGEMHYPNPTIKKLKNPYDSYTINFKENKNGSWVLDNVTYVKKITLGGVIDKEILESGKLVIYDYDDLIDTKRMSSVFIQSDLDLIKNMSYDAEFWQKNEVIRRSNIEKSLIKSFENSRGFESNFIDKK